jgi:Leucine-rich repeat (LRR) protein
MHYKTFDYTRVELNNVNDIYNISNPDTVKILYLYNNKLTYLDKDIFNNLINLQELFLYNNNLTHLDKDIFKNLTNLKLLNLSYNNISSLDKDIFKYLTNLKVLLLHNNHLTILNNNIFNNLTNFQYLKLSNNKLTSLPSSITNCRNLINIYYYNNEINYIPPNIHRFLNNLKQTSKKLQIYNDSQNVHNHHIQECIKTSLENILNYPKTINKSSLINELLNSKMNDRSLRLLLEYCNDNSVHSVLNITFEEALLHVLEYINLELKDNRNDILNILETEILDSECKCFTGRISRLINCLNGYTPLVKVEIPDNMAISNIIVMVKKSYKDDNVDELKELVKTELLERGYALNTITEYIEYIDI